MHSFFNLKRKIKNKIKIKAKKLVGLNPLYEPKKSQSFAEHEKYLLSQYPEVKEAYSESIIPENLLNNLKNYINSSTCLEGESLKNEYFRYDPMLEISKHSIETVKSLISYIPKAYCLDAREESIKKLHDYIRKEFKDYFKSPIIFVNSRAWITPPNSEIFGPNKLHTDKFLPGHLKIMIYPNGLSKNKGQLKIGEDLIAERSPGYAVAFKNSDILHAGIPGLSENRLSVEITIMRSLVPSEQINRSHFNGRHLISPILAYYNRKKLISKSLRKYLRDYWNIYD